MSTLDKGLCYVNGRMCSSYVYGERDFKPTIGDVRAPSPAPVVIIENTFADALNVILWR